MWRSCYCRHHSRQNVSPPRFSTIWHNMKGSINTLYVVCVCVFTQGQQHRCWSWCEDSETVWYTWVAVSIRDSAVELQRLRQNLTNQVIDFWKCHIEPCWIRTGLPETNKGLRSTLVSVAWLSFTLMMLMRWIESQSTLCSFLPASPLLICSCVQSGRIQAFLDFFITEYTPWYVNLLHTSVISTLKHQMCHCRQK